MLPPLTQLNTPYPSISYLAQDLRRHGIACSQRDLGIELVLRMLSRSGLEAVFEELADRDELPEEAWRALSLAEHHLEAIDSAIAFLQGKADSMAPRILETGFLPAGPRMQQADLRSFGVMGGHDAARYLATLYVADMSDLITSCVDEGFALSRYQAHLATSAEHFSPLWERLGRTTLVDQHLDALCDSIPGEVVGLSVPFPGNLYGALRLGRRLKERGAYVVMGGGYINTELRDVEEEKLWQCVDAITYDDGEGPLRAILQHRTGGTDERHRTRTANGFHNANVPRPPFTSTPFYGDLDLSCYLQTIDTLNPAHRLWADGRWNKITLAHGCYWKKCTFCDISLDYIGHYESGVASSLVDQIEVLIEETGELGFHFVDEAAPPKLLRSLAIEILRRGLKISFWGNIRFEKSYDADLCRLLAAAGLIAVTGGLEVANERLLKRIDKGVTVEQVARCTSAFQDAGVMVHAYLMYGFPTQTEQETIDSMELVRQLFACRLINSAFWHRFVLTRHAPIYKAPEDFGVQLALRKTTPFAQNDVPHLDAQGCDHDKFDAALPLALEAWLKGDEIDQPLGVWFDTQMPPTSEDDDRISSALKSTTTKTRGRLLWLGGAPMISADGLVLHTPDAEGSIACSEEVRDWLCQLLEMASPKEDALTLDDALRSTPGDFSKMQATWNELRELGLLIL